MLDSSRRKQLEREAMAKAVEDARLNAETLAQAAGAKLGPVRDPERLGLSAADADVPPGGRDGRHGRRPPPEATYQAGEMKFSAVVNAEYDLLVGP